MTAAPPRTQHVDYDRIKAAQAGEAAAWESIYAELAGPVTGYLRSRGAPDPDDLSSEVFYQIARDIHRFKGDETKFRSWVFVIAHRRLIDARRAAGRRPVTVDEPETQVDISGDNVEEAVMESLGTDRMGEIFENLTEDQQQVLSLRIVGDLSLEETASVMGKRVGAIKALQRRALAAVKTLLDEGSVSL
ncbi:MAG TPA: sigma-70 family RNA polymerase sigma factor [Acidimicrobiia bacterium]|nr:sigma-70 family RNA polymerase sigma factor [Acidimicrobiia bacterium]